MRAEHGLSVRELAALVHHGKSYVHELETGHKRPTTDVARRLDDALARVIHGDHQLVGPTGV